jgi:hypothetical protein
MKAEGITAARTCLWRAAVTVFLLVPLLTPPSTFAQSNTANVILQAPRFVLTCEALGRIKSEHAGQYQYEDYASIVFAKETQDCATNLASTTAYSTERWSAAVDSLTQSANNSLKAAASKSDQSKGSLIDRIGSAIKAGNSPPPDPRNQMYAQEDRLRYFSNWAPGIASETATAIAKRSGESPLQPMSFDDSTDPATRVTQFFNYLSVRAAVTDLKQRREAILRDALGTGKLAPVLPPNYAVTTCVEFADLMNGLSVAYAAAVEPVFSACYGKPNDPLAYDMSKLWDFFEKTNAAFPREGKPWGSGTISARSEQYVKMAQPYVKPYREKQALLAAEQKQKTELAAAEQKRDAELAAKAAYEQAVAKRFGSVPQVQRVVWEGSKESVSSVLTPAETAFNELNRETLAAEQTAAAGSQFRASPKGEFEKTADHDARIASERKAFEIDQARRLPSLVADHRKTALQRQFGTPAITGLAYNADTETYRVQIGATRADYRVVLSIPVPLSQAQAVKNELQAATPLLLVDLSPSGMTLKSVVLRSGEQWRDGTIVEATRSPIAFGAQSLAVWDARIATRKAAQQVADQKAAAAQAVRDAEAARQAQAERVARNRRFNHSGPYLRAGAIVCLDMKGAMIADAIASSGNAYMATPAACKVLNDDIAPLAEAQAAVGDFSRVRLRGATGSGFTSSWNVIP